MKYAATGIFILIIASLSESTLSECRKALTSSWEKADELGKSIRESGELNIYTL